MTSPTPGWYADPEYPARHRWWNGATWTDQDGRPVALSAPKFPRPTLASATEAEFVAVGPPPHDAVPAPLPAPMLQSPYATTRERSRFEPSLPGHSSFYGSISPEQTLLAELLPPTKRPRRRFPRLKPFGWVGRLVALIGP